MENKWDSHMFVWLRAMEYCTLGTTELNNLERAQRYAAKIIQGLGPNTRTEAALGSIGFWEMEAYIDKAKLIYFGRLCMLGPDTTTKQVFVNRLFSFRYRQGEERVMGFIPDVMRLLQKYDLQEFLETHINVTSNTFLGKQNGGK
jgi:hypothetical protein